MSAQHTPGRLALELVESDTGTIKHLCPVDAESMSLLTVVDHEETKFAAVYSDYDARRLVACWNACESLPTDILEDESIMKIDSRIRRERDDLLEALKLADCLLSGANMNREVVEHKVRAAIAKAEGGAA